MLSLRQTLILVTIKKRIFTRVKSVIILCCFLVYELQQRQKKMNFSYQTIIFVFFVTITRTFCEKRVNNHNDENNIKNSNKKIPLKLLRCMKENNSFYCMKLFLLETFEYNTNITLDGNINKEFFDKIFFNKNLYVKNNKYYEKLNETVLNERLMKSFEHLFIEHEIKFYFIPGVIIKIIPNSKNQSVNFSFKQGM